MSTISGHGISDSVRRSISSWLSNRVIDVLFEEARRKNLPGTADKAGFASGLRREEAWKRIKRYKSTKAGVWARTYYSKLFGKGSVGLTVLTNPAKAGKPEDMYIEYVTITLASRAIGGGRVSIPSSRLATYGVNRSIKDFEATSLFAEFDEAELARLTAELEFGEEAMFGLLEEERVA